MYFKKLKSYQYFTLITQFPLWEEDERENEPYVQKLITLFNIRCYNDDGSIKNDVEYNKIECKLMGTVLNLQTEIMSLRSCLLREFWPSMTRL